MIIPKVLLVTPDFKIPGGVSEFNKILVKNSKQEVTTFVVYSAGRNMFFIWSFLFLIYDLIRFTIRTASARYNIVHINPSLGKTSILRDSVFAWIAKLFGKKVFVHWHGWNPKNEYLLSSYKVFLTKTMLKADHIKFLSSNFQKQFQQIGYFNKSSLGNTFIDDKLLINNFKKDRNHVGFNILFLSAVSKNKGIYETLEIYKILKEKYAEINLTVAGIGIELDAVKDLVKRKNITGVEFKGFVSGKEKSQTYINADIYLFPSYYEGMPTSVIEAMGFSLPVICSSVGALADFFINEKMGFIVRNQNIRDYVASIEKLIINEDLRTDIGTFNYKFTQEHFLASNTIAKIDRDYNELINF